MLTNRPLAPARSWLFVPGDRPERFAKALSAADGVILDLEDAVAPAGKARARANVVDFLRERAPDGPLVAVRISPPATLAGLEDLRAILRPDLRLDALVVAKVEDAAVVRLLAGLADEAGLAARFVALIESAGGVHDVAGIARGCDRLAGLMFGAADYAADLGRLAEDIDARYARARVANAAAMAGLVAIDSPFFAYGDTAALSVSCAEARRLGFHAKAAIHPRQVPFIDQCFSPTPAELKHARTVIALSDGGAGAIDGKMIDMAILRWARGIVSRAT